MLLTPDSTSQDQQDIAKHLFARGENRGPLSHCVQEVEPEFVLSE